MVELAYIMIYVDDMDRAVEFYREEIGLPLERVEPGRSQFRTGGAELVLRQRVPSDGRDSQGGRVHLAFRVQDVPARYRELFAEGVRFVSAPALDGSVRNATLLDPEGNVIDLIEGGSALDPVSPGTIVNDIVNRYPETMEALEDHGIRICGGCIVLLNSPVAQTADYSGLGAPETERLVHELNDKVRELSRAAVSHPAESA